MATEVVRTIRASGGDYTSITDWNATESCNLTQSLVFAYSSPVNTLSAGDTVTGQSSNASGTVVGSVVRGQIIITNITGNFQAGEIVSNGVASVTILDNGDLAIPVAELYNDWPGGMQVGQIQLSFTTNSSSYPIIRAAEGHRASGTLPSGFHFYGSEFDGVSGEYIKFEYIGFNQGSIRLWDNTTCVGCWILGGGGFSHIRNNSKLICCLVAESLGGIFFRPDGTGSLAYNCAAIKTSSGFFSTYVAGYTENSALLVNCLSDMLDLSFAYPAFSDAFTNLENSNNLSYDSSAPGLSPIYYATVEFVNPTARDFHLSQTDTFALGNGIDLSNNPYFIFNTDIDGETIGPIWSIGPDQMPAPPMPEGFADGIFSGIQGAGISGTVSIHGDMVGNIHNFRNDTVWYGSVDEVLVTMSGFLPQLRSTTGPIPARMTGEFFVDVVGNGLMYGDLPGWSGVSRQFDGEVTTSIAAVADGSIVGFRGCLFDGDMMGWMKGWHVIRPSPEMRGRVSSYSVHLARQTRKPSTVITIDQDFCQHTFGTNPCFASGAPCFNTLATCKYINSYNPEPKRYIYCLNDTPVNVSGNITRPYLKEHKINAMEILTSKSVILNAAAQLSFYDDADKDYGVDPYRVDDNTRTAPGGSESITVGGTYWQRWLRRNKYYKNRRVTIWNGFDIGVDDTLDGYNEEFRGVLDNIAISKNGLVQMTVKGLLQLTDHKIPRKTDGKLFSPLSADTTDKIQLQPWTGVDTKAKPYTSKYSSGLIKIGNEIIRYGSVDVDQKTGITTFNRIAPEDETEQEPKLLRGQYNAYGWNMPQSHNLGDDVQEVEFFDGNPIDIILNLLGRCGIEGDDINLPTFNNVKNEYIPNVYFASVIDKPIEVKKLLAELREQTGSHIWQDESQRISIRYMAPAYPWVSYKKITDMANIVYQSSSFDAQQSKRVTRATVYYNHHVGNELKEENFYHAAEYRDGDAEHEYGHNETKSRKPVLSRWIWKIHGGESYAATLAADLVDLFVDGAAQISFSLELKDSLLALGEIFEIENFNLTNEYGHPITQRYMVTKRQQASRGKFNYVATTTGLEGRWLLIAPDIDYPDNWVDGTGDQQTRGCISDEQGLAPDGGEGYKITRG